MNAVGMATGGSLLLVLSAASGEAFVIPELARTWLAQAYLVIGGSLAVFGLFIVVLHRWTATGASYQFVMIPPVTIALSAWLQDERITLVFLGGTVLVLAGVYVGALLRPARAQITPQAFAEPAGC
jgi:drug/metabolite transporter (DMT)-like permease